MSENINIVEELNIKSEYFLLAKELLFRMQSTDVLTLPKLTIAVGGESGSGKSTSAYCLREELSTQGISSTILHMDSYFKLPPKDNHKRRTESLDFVGPQEVDLEKINNHISSFKNNEVEIQIPVVNYFDNNFTYRTIQLDSVDVLIIEGVYSFLLENLDLKIFLEKTYKHTLQNRLKRTRENHEPLIETILEIEHNIVKSLRSHADYIIAKDYSLL